MLRSQRILIIVVVLLIAVILHLSLCDWVFSEPVGMDRVAGYDHPRHSLLLTMSRAAPRMPEYTGLITGTFVGHTEALMFGVIVPMLLATVAIYLLLGAKHSSRLRRGQCLNCGYDLRSSAQPLSKCPECGTPVPPPRA